MLYQLPNGKVIYLTIEEYLALEDQDIQDLVASNQGTTPTSNWHGSVIKYPTKSTSESEEEIDMRSLEELDDDDQINIDKLSDDDYESIEI
jgi:hypothetical protein